MTRAYEDAVVGPYADVVLEAPTDELTETEGVVDIEANPPEYDVKQREPTKRRRRRKRQLEHPALDLYGGYDGLLVRTALIRSAEYDDKALPRLQGPTDVALMCRHLMYAPHEYMVTLPINNRGEVLAIHEAAIGPAGHVAFSPTQVIKVAFLTGATGMVAVHNHPSGDPRPSDDDVATTAAMAGALSCVGLTLMDHIIVARDGYFSFADVIGQNLERAAELSHLVVRRESGRRSWPLRSGE